MTDPQFDWEAMGELVEELLLRDQIGDYDHAVKDRLRDLDADRAMMLLRMDRSVATSLLAEGYRMVQAAAAEQGVSSEQFARLLAFWIYGFQVGHDYADRHGSLREQ